MRKPLHAVLFLCLYTNVAHSQALSDTQRKLQQLDQKIGKIQQDLSHAHTRQTALQHELASTTQSIQQNEQRLQHIQQNIAAKKIDIAEKEQKIASTQQHYAKLQNLLMQQIQANYQHMPHQPFTWLLQPTHKNDIDRLLTYYQSIVHAHEHMLQEIKTTQRTLQQAQDILQHDIAALEHMRLQAQHAQIQLEKHKNRYQTLLDSVQHQVSSQETTLGQYERNRDNLSKILRQLNQTSVIRTHHAMSSMKSKLPYPIQGPATQIHPLHQGIMLYSLAGTPVHAVYPGKVVFCEWLNGYGLLMILDHGWGLMTLYANNHHLIKHLGDTVSQGEQIATVGQGGISKQSGLYFEVRKNGKAIPPLDWLAKS